MVIQTNTPVVTQSAQTYEVGAYTYDSEILYAPILQGSIARKIFPISTVLAEKDKKYTYSKYSVDYYSTYTADPVGIKPTTFSLTDHEVKVPIIGNGFVMNRADRQRAEASKLDISGRIAALAPRFREDEDIISIAGDPDMKVTSFTDTTNNTTAVSTPLNVTSEALILSTLMDQISQLATAVGDYSTLKQYPLVYIHDTDTYTIATKTPLTISAPSDRMMNGADYIQALLNKFGAPNSIYISSPYLGSAVTRNATTGKRITSNPVREGAFYPYSPEFLEIAASPIIQTVEEGGMFGGVAHEFTERWVPAFKNQSVILYDTAPVIA